MKGLFMMRMPVPLQDAGVPELTKDCPGAGEQLAHTLPVSKFSSDRSRLDGRAPYCKVCAAFKQRAWKKANPARVREMKRVARGGLKLA